MISWFQLVLQNCVWWMIHSIHDVFMFFQREVEESKEAGEEA